jgi:hypothetical protein
MIWIINPDDHKQDLNHSLGVYIYIINPRLLLESIYSPSFLHPILLPPVAKSTPPSVWRCVCIEKHSPVALVDTQPLLKLLCSSSHHHSSYRFHVETDRACAPRSRAAGLGQVSTARIPPRLFAYTLDSTHHLRQLTGVLLSQHISRHEPQSTCTRTRIGKGRKQSLPVHRRELAEARPIFSRVRR